MSPLQSDYSNPEQDFWRAWNQRVADGGQQKMGAFQQEYNFNQGVQAMPLKDRIPLQYRMQQDAMEAARNASMDRRLQGNDSFSQWAQLQRLRSDDEEFRYRMGRDSSQDQRQSMMDRRLLGNDSFNQQMQLQRLKYQEEAARRAGMQKPVDPMDVMRERSALMNVPDPLAMLEYIDNNPNHGNTYEFDDSLGVKQTRNVPDYYIEDMRKQRAGIYPGLDQQKAVQRSVNSLSNAAGAVGAMFPTPQRQGHPDLKSAAAASFRRQPLTPDEVERLKRYQSRNTAEMESLIPPEYQMYSVPH